MALEDQKLGKHHDCGFELPTAKLSTRTYPLVFLNKTLNNRLTLGSIARGGFSSSPEQFWPDAWAGDWARELSRINRITHYESMVPGSNSSLLASDSATLERFASAVMRVQSLTQHPEVREPSPATTNGNADETELAEAVKESDYNSSQSARLAAGEALSASSTAIAPGKVPAMPRVATVPELASGFAATMEEMKEAIKKVTEISRERPSTEGPIRVDIAMDASREETAFEDETDLMVAGPLAVQGSRASNTASPLCGEAPDAHARYRRSCRQSDGNLARTTIEDGSGST